MRKTLIAVGIVVVVLLGGIAALPFIIDPNQFRGTVQSELEKQLKRPVTLGNMVLKVYPLAIRIENVNVGQPAGFESSEPFLAAKDVSVGVALWPLLRKQVKIETVTLTSPSIELIRNADGTWNYETGSSSSTSSGSSSTSVTLDEAQITDGKVAITDKKAGTPRSVYQHINLTAKNMGPGRHSSIDGSVRLETMGASLSTNSEFENTAGAFAAKGTLALKSDKAPDPLNVTYDASEDPKTEIVTVKSLAAKIGALALTGSGSVDTKQKPPALALDVKTANTPVRELLRLAALFGAKFPPDLQADGNLSVDMHVGGTTDKPQLQGKVDITKAEISGKSLAAPVRASELHAEMTPETLTIKPFTLETGGTLVTAQASVSGYSDPEPKIEAEVKTSGAKVDELLRMADAYGVRPEGLKGSGTISLDAKVSKNGKKFTYAGSGALHDVQIASPDLPKPLDIANANITFSDDRVGLNQLQASMSSMHLKGSASVRDFDRPDIKFQGDIDQLNVNELRDWRSGGSASAPAKKNGESSLSKMTVNGNLTVGKIVYDQVVLSNVKATIALANGVLKLSPVSTDLFGGHDSGSITADLRNPTASYSIRSSLSGVDANQLLSAVSSMKNVLTGALSGNADVQFLSKPNEEIAKSLNGTAQINMGPGKLAGFHIVDEIANVGKFLNWQHLGSATQPFTTIEKMGGTLKIVNGLATTNDLQVVFDGGSLSATGTIGLVDQMLNLKLDTVLGQQYGQKANSGQVGGLLTTVLANAKGELVVPAVVTGPIAKPHFAPDPGRIAQMKMKGLLPTANNPAALVSGVKGLMDAFTGKKPAADQTQDQAKPQEQKAPGIVDIIDQLRKKKEQKK